MSIVTIGIDLAKNVFSIHGVNQAGKPALVLPAVKRAKLHETIAALPPCLIGMEACCGAHHWTRLFAQHGHSVCLMAQKFVAPYRMSGVRGKTNAADAAAICEAVTRPSMRFVSIKSVGATIGAGHEFRCGREFAAWLGLTPGQYSPGGKTRLGRITKAGDGYIRSLLVMGARAVLAAAPRRKDSLSRWTLALQEQRGYWRAVVAIAAKNARMCWAVLRFGETFRLPRQCLAEGRA